MIITTPHAHAFRPCAGAGKQPLRLVRAVPGVVGVCRVCKRIVTVATTTGRHVL